jgi:DNA-binding transcriptional ArsR family regulator/uncharacterized protein YndB with AHSA1/START domain
VTQRDDKVWKALADPVRREILDRLRDGPRTTGALCEGFAISRFGVMKHLDALEAAELVAVERRGRERWNYLNAVALEGALKRWTTPFQRQWSERLSALTRLLQGDPMMDDVSPFLDIRQEHGLPAPRERVFAALTADIGLWWTSPFRQAGAESRLTLEPRVGAPMLEIGPDGHEVIWARVEEIHAPERLYLSGRFAVIGAVAGRIHFDLSVEPSGGCRLVVSHQAVGRISAEMQASFHSGWTELLDRRLRAHLA